MTARARRIAVAGGAVMAVGLLLTAPAQAFKISYQQLSPNYDPSELFYAGDDRDFWTIILGNPFNAPKPAVDRSILDAMASTRWGKRTNFTTTPDDTARRAYRIIVLINGATATGYQICAYYPDRPLGPGRYGGEISVVATYCRGESPLTQATGTVDATGPDDPDLRQFIRQLMVNLLPPFNPNQPKENDRWRRR
jgi:hypothetical protein